MKTRSIIEGAKKVMVEDIVAADGKVTNESLKLQKEGWLVAENYVEEGIRYNELVPPVKTEPVKHDTATHKKDKDK